MKLKLNLLLKGKGFEEILCLIENDKARIFVKNASELTESQKKANSRSGYECS